MEHKEEEITQKKWYQKRVFHFLAGFLVLLFFLQAVLYFAGDFLLRGYLKEKIRVASEEKYEIDFEKVHVLFLQRGFSFQGLTINPLDETFASLENIPYYRVNVPYVSITGLNYLFGSKELVLGNVKLSAPAIDFRLKIEELTDELQDESPLEILQSEIKKSFLESRIQDIRIKTLEIDNADLLIKNFIAQRSMKAENSNLMVKNIQLLKDRDPATPFNAEGFYFEIENFELLLADSVHQVSAEQLEVSSLEQYINARNLSIDPDFSRFSETYFQASLKDLMLSDADINKVFYTSEVEVGKLRLQSPKFELYTGKTRKKSEEGEVEAFDFYDLIDGILASIEIGQFDIEAGEFAQKSIADPDGYRIKAERIDFNMMDFYVGPDESRKANRFFYADQANVELYGVDLFLADSVHQVKGNIVSLSSSEDKITIEGFKLFPIEETDTIRGITLLEIDVPQLTITDAKLKKIYNDGIVDVRDILVEKPEIMLRDVRKKVDGSPGFDFSAFYSEYLEGIYVQRFEIKEGSLIVDNRLRIRQDSLSFGKVNLVLENFAIDEATEAQETKSFFWAENLQLELNDYALKLSDNLHMFKADRVYLDTKSAEVSVEGFTIKPFNPGQIQSILDRYGRSTSLDIFVPRFTAVGVNIRDAYFDERLVVDRINVPSPKISIMRHRAAALDGEQEDVDQKEILDLLTSYFNEVRIGSLSLQRGTLNYENLVREKLRTFSEDNVSITVRNFYISADTDPENLRFLYSEEVDLNLNNYVFNIADGKYNILADRINFNTAREEIIAANVRLNPRSNLQDKTIVSAAIPEMSFRGVDLEAFLFENTLNLEKVRLAESTVKVLINRDFEQEDEVATRRQRRDRNLPKTIDVVNIDTVQAEKAQFTLSFKEGGSQSELIDTGIDVAFYDFFLDSAKIAKGEIAGFFSGMALGIDEFWLTLNDSVHQVTFSKVELDTRYEGILLNNFRVIPRTLSGKPGKPVFSGHIPAALIKINSLADLQSSKDLWVKEMRLFRPDVEIFVDQLESEVSEPQEAPEGVKEYLIETFQLDDFEIVEGHFGLFQKDGSKAPREIRDVNLAIRDIKLNMEEFEGLSPKMILDKDFEFNFPNYNLLLKDSLNKVAVGLVSIKNNEVILSDVIFEPRFGKYDYLRRLGYQTDVIKVHIPEIRVVKPDLALFLDQEILKAEQLLIKDIQGEFFRDKRLDRPEDIYRLMPQALMKEFDFVVRLDSLLVQNGKIIYLEFPDKGMVPGEIYFSDMQVAMAPFHMGQENESYPLDSARLLAKAKINGVAELGLQGDLIYTAPYPMHITAQLEAFDLELINSILKSNAFVRVRGGRIDGADWHFTANDKEAIGQMRILYSDLNLELLEERTLQRGRGRKSILTFVLNVFAVRSNNPRKFFNNTVSSKIYHPRDKDRFIFNYWWRATLSGLQGSVGLGQPKVPKRKEDE